MSEQSWKPLFRASQSTVTKVLRSPAFAHSRDYAAASVDDPVKLRALADRVEGLEYLDAPLSAVVEHVTAAVRFLRARADALDGGPSRPDDATGVRAPGDAARERLLVASLHYLVTPVDMVPDFQIGGYIDDVILLSWIFGAAHQQLEPFLEGGPDV
jgi:hypothetical protein